MTGGRSSDEWEPTVPAADAELLAELRRHGVRPGRRLHVILDADDGKSAESNTVDEAPSFFASFSGRADLAERSSDNLRAEFPHGE